MISGGEGDIILKEASEFLSEGGGKLWSSVRDHLGVETELRENLGEKSWATLAVSMFFVQGQ